MKRVILESPYAGDVERNVKYARACVRDSLGRNEAPIASHLLYTQEGILKDDIPEERQWGIDAGLAWKSVAEKHVSELAHTGGKSHKMCVPPMITDTDMIFSELIRRFKLSLSNTDKKLNTYNYEIIQN